MTAGGISLFNFDFSFVRSGAPIITLSATGIAFNSGARAMLNYPPKIDIGYDEERTAIGVCEHRIENQGKPYEFEGREKDGWIRISCRDFMRYLSLKSGIDFTKAKQFIPEFDKTEQMLIVIVDKEHLKRAQSKDSE